MKKVIFIAFFFTFTLNLMAQERDEHREKIRALKTAYITDGLNLTPQEAQQFWPVYNEFESKRRELYMKERADIKNLECMNEVQANQKLQEYVELERQDYLLKKQYFEDLKKFFSAKKIMELKKIEEEFNRKLMREYRERLHNSEKQAK